MKKIFIVLIVIALTVAVFYSCARQVTENTGNDFSEMDNTDGGNNNSNGNNIGSSSAIYNFLDLVITEINWGGSYSNTTDATPNGEFVEIMNNTSSPINLTGFQLRYDGGGDFTNKRVTLPSIVLNPGEFLVVFITNSSNNPYELVLNTNTYKTFLWSGINYIGNGGFRIAIIAPNGEEIDFVETRSGKPGQVMMKGSSGMPKRTMERVLPFISGTNNSAWEAAVSNINYAYGGTNNLGTPGASNSVWFVFRAILLATPTNNTTINKALNSTQNFVWMLTGLGSSYSSYILVFTTSNQVFTNISVNTTNTNINILAFPVETYKWFVLGVSGGITNS
ncbi:MAG: lamin tail domain-containing protein, partial [Brevinematales bacterium]|nr:lamin tail domain-containing protein [Brevinematales bacterium]